MSPLLGESLRTLRTARGLSLAQAADRANVSKSALAHWEAERRVPPGEALASLLSTLGASSREQARLLAIADPRHARLVLADEDKGSPVSLGELLRAMRLRREMTQEEFSRLGGVRQSTVARWERGDQEIAPQSLDDLLLAMEATADERSCAASLDPKARPTQDLDARYHHVTQAPHGYGETLWIGIEADLWWRSARSDAYEERLHTVLSHRADWYALSLRPKEALPLARRVLRSRYGAPSDVPQGTAYAIAQSTLQLRADPLPAIQTLKLWSERLRAPDEIGAVQALRALLMGQIDPEAGLRMATAAQATMESDVMRDFATAQKARLQLTVGDPAGALETLGDGKQIDLVTLRVRADIATGREPDPAELAAVRERPASKHIPLYRERVDDIDRALVRLRRRNDERAFLS